MKRGEWVRSFSLSLLLCGLATSPAAAQAPPGPAGPPEASALTDLDRTEQRWLQAYERRDPVAMDAILAPGFSITFPSGRVFTRENVIAQVSGPSSGPRPRFTTQDVETRPLGEVAVRTGVLVTETSRGRTLNRYTDTWIRTDGRWRVVASHLSEGGGE